MGISFLMYLYCIITDIQFRYLLLLVNHSFDCGCGNVKHLQQMSFSDNFFYLITISCWGHQYWSSLPVQACRRCAQHGKHLKSRYVRRTKNIKSNNNTFYFLNFLSLNTIKLNIQKWKHKRFYHMPVPGTGTSDIFF